MSGYVPNPPKNFRYEEAKPVDIHAQRWAEYEKHGKEPAPEPEKIGIALRIGVFFDGTGNNANNTAAGLLCGAQHPIAPQDIPASCQPYMSDPDSSYGAGLTNVKKLHSLYKKTQKAQGDSSLKYVSRPVYVDGIGTVNDKKDSAMGSGLGRGATGVSGRVQASFAQIKEAVEDVLQDNPDSEIVSLTFDTFGFSRGAAAARHFSNEIVRGKQGPLGDLLNQSAKDFSRNFDSQYGSGINMGFIGLFDTVPSIAGFTNFGQVQSPIAPGVKLYLDRRFFKDVVHLVARDECRANFALSRVKPDHPEYTLPGVHSDIGGSYLDEVEECVLVSPMQTLTVSLYTDVTTTSIYHDAERVKSQWIGKGWPAHLLEVVTPTAVELPKDNQDRLAPREKRVYAALQLKRPVSGKLSRIYLRVMYQLAKEKGVQFADMPADAEHSIPQELQSLCDRFVAGDYRTTPEEEKLLMLNYIHTSANWNHPLGRKDGSGIDAVYINAPTEDAVRVQHPHVPERNLW
ncbi:T6SS phospholipase effector Tle1-like catalytic domain-containing protein [Pseudomonas sp. McL0111]|uniref:T6SS phospholipase effector Tle1-like catalytic domain-containing protein n=1 Tax=Pseudomonas sp. McL0111 TaxID=3457357 RepID=UPI00403E8ABE